jgi:hypothetical protein
MACLIVYVYPALISQYIKVLYSGKRIKNPLVVSLEAPINLHNQAFLISAPTFPKTLFIERIKDFNWVTPIFFMEIDENSRFFKTWSLTSKKLDKPPRQLNKNSVFNLDPLIKITVNFLNLSAWLISSLGDKSLSPDLSLPISSTPSVSVNYLDSSDIFTIPLVFSWSIFNLVDESSPKIFSWPVSSTEALDSSKKTAPHRPSQASINLSWMLKNIFLYLLVFLWWTDFPVRLLPPTSRQSMESHIFSLPACLLGLIVCWESLPLPHSSKNVTKSTNMATTFESSTASTLHHRLLSSTNYNSLASLPKQTNDFSTTTPKENFNSSWL